MKILLTSLNAKFIHANLAIRCLQSYCQKEFSSIGWREFTINDQIADIAAEIYREKAAIVAFSCYIWNIKATLAVADILKKVSPQTIIILGGPEVSYDPIEVLDQQPYVDFVVFGEGEETFHELLQSLSTTNFELANIAGLAYRKEGQVFKNQARKLINNLDLLPFPYQQDLDQLANKIIYYESSRGCPFQCQYCLSSTIEGVRLLSLDRVKKDLSIFMAAGVKQVKFVDRTFNCDRSRAFEIIKFILNQGSQTKFHFEVAADLIDSRLSDLLATAPDGILQLEIGIQSTNENTLQLVQRKMNLAQVKENVLKIGSLSHVHQHLDLIAGLPGESYSSFKNSFNEVMALKPDVLQLGFLKLLKGSGIRAKAEQYQYRYITEPPYEVLSNDSITYEEILKLKLIEDLLEKYGNSQRFKYSLSFFSSAFETPFDMYEQFAAYWVDNGYQKVAHSNEALFSIIYKFYISRVGINKLAFNELLKFDFFLHNKNARLPAFIKQKESVGFRERCWEFLKDQEKLLKFLPHYQSLPAKQIINKVHFEAFSYNIIDLIQEKSPQDNMALNETIILFDYPADKLSSWQVIF